MASGPTRSVSPPVTNATSQYNPLQGSVASNEKSTTQLSLTLQDAIQRGLRYNLGLLVGDQSTRSARAEELRARAALLPNLSAGVSNTYEQVNLAAFGFNFKFPGINIPSIVGPFNVFDARAYLSQTVLDFTAINNRRSATESARAADLSLKDTRDLVVQLVASGYLQVIADQARVDEAQSEVDTAQVLNQRAQDMKNAGLTPAIDALRAQVELQSEQTRLRGLQNDRAKDLLALARLIGVPLEQAFVLTDTVPFAPLTTVTVETAFDKALKDRSDYQAAAAQVRAAEASKRAAEDERLPSADINADYGAIGSAPWSSHGTLTLTGSVRVSIFDSGRIRADIEQADAVLQQRKAEEADLRQRIDQQIRNALLDLQTAADQVSVARSSVELAHEALTQSQDRFSAGVADNIEVVQAQNAVVNAAEQYISSVNAHNMAKVALARGIGIADQGVREYLGGK
ncbi:MAG: TolC family protein [Bryobacteraceae bacterium]